MMGFGVYQSPFFLVIKLLTSCCLLDEMVLHKPKCETHLISSGFSFAETSTETWDIVRIRVFLVLALISDEEGEYVHEHTTMKTQ